MTENSNSSGFSRRALLAGMAAAPFATCVYAVIDPSGGLMRA